MLKLYSIQLIILLFTSSCIFNPFGNKQNSSKPKLLLPPSGENGGGSGPLSGNGTGGGGNTPLSSFASARLVMQNHCFSCHGDWTQFNEQDYINTSRVTPGRPDLSPVAYRTLFSPWNVPNAPRNMPLNNPTGFTNQDFGTIVRWIQSITPSSGGEGGSGNEGGGMETSQVAIPKFQHPVYLDAIGILNVLGNIFGTTTQIWQSVAQIGFKPGTLGGACDPGNRYGGPYPCYTPGTNGNPDVPRVDTASYVQHFAKDSPHRHGEMMRVCDQLVFDNPSLQNAINQSLLKLNITLNNVPTYLTNNPIPINNELQAIYRLFHPGEALPGQILSLLNQIAIEARGFTPQDPLASRRFIFLWMCTSPSWQIL